MERFGATPTRSEEKNTDPVVVLLNDINSLLTSGKPKMKQTAKYTSVVKQLLNALSGTNFNLIRSAEYYSDLKETLLKIHSQVKQASKRTLVSRLMISFRDTQSAEEIQKTVDKLCGRIFMFYAHRRLMKKASVSQHKPTL